MFRPFFIRLNLPYSVKRGEQFALQVLVFNYLEDEQEVRIFYGATIGGEGLEVCLPLPFQIMYMSKGIVRN